MGSVEYLQTCYNMLDDGSNGNCPDRSMDDRANVVLPLLSLIPCFS